MITPCVGGGGGGGIVRVAAAARAEAPWVVPRPGAGTVTGGPHAPSDQSKPDRAGEEPCGENDEADGFWKL